MIHPVRWKISLMAATHLYLNGGDPKVIRDIVKHLNVLYNTELVMCSGLEEAVAVLEALTKRICGEFDHHGDDSHLAPDARMSYIEMQLIAARHL
ncbi:hypothetical protein D3C81_379050 [compost metagenome]